MRKIILLLCLCIAAWSFAGDSVKKESLRAITKPGTNTSIKKTDVITEKFNAVRERSEQRVLEARNANAQFVGKLDSLVYIHPDGTNYTKQVYEYNEDYFDTSEKFYVWDGNEWFIITAYNYEWDKKDGKVYQTAEEEINYLVDDDGQPFLDDDGQRTYTGSRYEYTYDQNDFLDSEIYIYIENEDMTPSLKTTYTNDNSGNATEIYQYAYSGIDWVLDMKAIIEYDNLNRETMVENYYWNEDWIGINKGIYTYDLISGNITIFEYPTWDSTTQTWVNYHKQIQEYDNNGRLIEQGEYFWNNDVQDWIGAIIWDQWVNCIKSIHTYNASGLQTTETSYKLQQDGETWKPTVEMVITYDPVPEEDGFYMYERKTYFDVNEEMEQRQTLKYKYYIASQSHTPVVDHKPLPANSVVTYAYEYNIQTLGGFEEFYTYDDALNLIESKEYIYEEETGIKRASICGYLEYDSNKNITKLTNMSGQGGEDDWAYTTMFEYEYGNDNIRTREYAYYYSNDEWLKNYGKGFDMDYSVLVNQLIVNIGYDNPYKVTFQYNYENNGSNEWDTYVRTFYYSSLDNSSVDYNNETLFSVSPNPVIDVITINSTEENIQVNIYNMQGAILLQTNEKQINMSGFTAGVYLLEVNGVKAKVVKK